MTKPLGLGKKKTFEISSDKPLEQLQELYDYALYLLEKQEIEDASDLFKGIINECNQNVKDFYNHSKVVDILVDQFYLIYGKALREYAIQILDNDQEIYGFLNAARDQFELGLEKKDDGFKNDLIVELITLNLYQGGIQAQIRLDIVDGITKNLLKCHLKNFNSIQKLKIGIELQKYADFMEDFKDRREGNDFALLYLKDLEFEITDFNFWNCMDGIASCFLSMANYFAEQVQVQEDLEEVCTDCESALEYLNQGLEWVNKALDANGNYAPALATRGEILIYISDIQAQLENSKDSEIYYKDAIESFRKCHAIDSRVLPDQFLENLDM